MPNNAARIRSGRKERPGSGQTPAAVVLHISKSEERKDGRRRSVCRYRKSGLFIHHPVSVPYPLTAPAVIPSMICFWKMTKRIITGRAEMLAPAIRCPQSID